MRSLLIALVLAAPVSCGCSCPNLYQSDDHGTPRESRRWCIVTFVNHTSQDREVRVGDDAISDTVTTRRSTFLIPVGSVVRLYSNTKLEGEWRRS